jgi:hypothetical protein
MDGITYVTKSDLVMNGPRKCTLLTIEPYADHLTIVQDESAACRRGQVCICDGDKVIKSRYMKPPRVGEGWYDIEPRFLTVGDLGDARKAVVASRLGCEHCLHYEHPHYLWNTKECNCSADSYINWKTGICPEKKER